MPKKIVPIKYTSRDYDSIRRDLIEHAKRYYPDTYKDFNEGSFGSLMIDTVSYVGDILSFYVDYQANESFLETASEFDNVLKIAKQSGFKYTNGASSTGIATFYISVPANSTGLGPNLNYAPTLKKGSTFSTKNGAKFILNEDVRFDLPANEVRPLIIGANGLPAKYGIKAHGQVISGIIKAEKITVGAYEKFLKIKLNEPNVVEILTVYDEEGNQYYEVDYLSQNVIYKSITNKDATSAAQAKEVLKPFIVPRRFTMETEIGATYLQFGASSDIVVDDANSFLTEPSRVVLNLFGKEYISSDSFDPTAMINSDKFGIAPSNTTLTVTYRYDPPGSGINFAVDSLTNVENTTFRFNDEQNLIVSAMSEIKSTLEITNEAPILGEAAVFDSKELKIRIQNSFSAQNRAVTVSDYKALAYAMPKRFGAIRRINVLKDNDSLKRNLNLYVLCEDGNGHLTEANDTVKQNLKTWLGKNKMLNDTIDILDGKIVNYGIEFTVLGSTDRAKYDILTDALSQLRKDFKTLYDFGETFFITNVYNSLKKVDGILDVINVKIVLKNGGVYADTFFNIDENTSPDKRYINVPLNVVFEMKYPNDDIKGTIL